MDKPYQFPDLPSPDNLRGASKLSTDLAYFSDYEKLEMSLRSGLANEVDFAVNVCLLLSNEGRHVLKLTKSIHLLPLLMANIGIFEEGDLQALGQMGVRTVDNFLSCAILSILEHILTAFVITVDNVLSLRYSLLLSRLAAFHTLFDCLLGYLSVFIIH